MSAQDRLAPGSLLGRYSIVREIASGGMAVVYEARHLDLMKRVAVKVMRATYADSPQLVQRFVLEARAASRLHHPHVIAIADIAIEGSLPYIVMDYLEGEDLCTVLAREGPMSSERIADVLLPVVSAVAATHAEGILHRDLKPENVFLARRGAREHPTLLDFGISQNVAGPKRALTRAGEVVGTPEYMSPEQIAGMGELDERADQYALGVILYECLTGGRPYRADTLQSLVAEIVRGGAPPPSSRRADVTPDLDAVVMRAMARDRGDRYATLRDFGRALWPFASPIAKAMWAEELGDPAEVAERLSGPRTSTPRPPVDSAPPQFPKEAPTQPRLRATDAPGAVTPADLHAFAAFEECSDAALDRLLATTRTRRFPAGAEIVRQGAHGHGCYLLVRGEVDVVKSTAGGRWILGRLQPGSVFGQISLVDHVPRTASAVAVGEVITVEIARDVFERMLAHTDEVAHALRLHIAIAGIRHLRRATRRLADLIARGAAARRGTDPHRELVYLQSAVREWTLPIDDDG